LQFVSFLLRDLLTRVRTEAIFSLVLQVLLMSFGNFVRLFMFKFMARLRISKSFDICNNEKGSQRGLRPVNSLQIAAGLGPVIKLANLHARAGSMKDKITCFFGFQARFGKTLSQLNSISTTPYPHPLVAVKLLFNHSGEMLLFHH
jgi:hypothetical protein